MNAARTMYDTLLRAPVSVVGLDRGEIVRGAEPHRAILPARYHVAVADVVDFRLIRCAGEVVEEGVGGLRRSSTPFKE